LLEEASKRLKSEDISYSFLGTGKSLVAYNLYEKLGYRDFTMFRRGLKKCEKTRSSDMALKEKVEKNILVDLFYEYSKDLLGFVKRPRNFMEIREAWSWFHYDLMGVFYEDEEPIGYVVSNREDKVLKIWELCCLRKEDYRKCILALEVNTDAEHIILELIQNSVSEKHFHRLGFKIFPDSFGILMVKDLKGDQSVKQIRKLYGIDDKKFHMTAIDEY
jgi:hypothetical protein